MSTTEIGHTATFHQLLNLLCLAAYENNQIDLATIDNTPYLVGGVPICSKQVFASEITAGCDLMANRVFYDAVKNRVAASLTHAHA
jgi:hypothetical protein